VIERSEAAQASEPKGELDEREEKGPIVADVALLIDWENVYYTLRQHTEGALPSTLSILQAIMKKAAEFGPVRVKLAIFGQDVASQDETLLMGLEFTGITPIPVAQRMSGRLLKGRSDAVLITRALRLLYKERPDIDTWFIVSGDRDLNALCTALKEEDKHVYLVAGDKSLANELRDSPYLRDDVFLLEDLIPEARWTRPVDAPRDRMEPPPRTRGGRGRGGTGRTRTPLAGPRPAPTVPAVVPTGEPDSEKEQRRLAVLMLDQLVALRAESMKRGDFVSGIVPLSEAEASQVLEKRIDAGIEQGHIVARAFGRSRAKANLLIKPNMSSPLVAETVFHLVRVLRRIRSVTADARRVPAVEAVLDPLSRADQPGGIARARSDRRILLETLFNIAEERGAIMTEQVQRDGRQITMCWLADGHPLVDYAGRPPTAIAHLFNFVHSTRAKDDTTGWVNAALFAELLARVDGDRLDAEIASAVERGLMRADAHGRRPGYVLEASHPEARAVLGEFQLLNGEGGGPAPIPAPALAPALAPAAAAAPRVALPASPSAGPVRAPVSLSSGPLGDDAERAQTEAPPPAEGAVPGAPPRKRTRRGSRGGRGRRGGRAPGRAPASGS
jgi:hypothetical protein